MFFSEDQAPAGNELDSTLQNALRRSQALIVVANRETLEDPRWVRTEVEEFRKVHPNRPVVAVCIGSAFLDPDLSASVRPWLAHEGMNEAQFTTARCFKGLPDGIGRSPRY